ncbi:MAG: hypothetical protein ACI4TD_03770 [Phocaeicola sp.]
MDFRVRDNVFVYKVSTPPSIKEMVMPCADGYTVYISDALSPEDQRAAYLHALWHIDNGDCEDECRGVDEKERVWR